MTESREVSGDSQAGEDCKATPVVRVHFQGIQSDWLSFGSPFSTGLRLDYYHLALHGAALEGWLEIPIGPPFTFLICQKF